MYTFKRIRGQDEIEEKMSENGSFSSSDSFRMMMPHEYLCGDQSNPPLE